MVASARVKGEDRIEKAGSTEASEGNRDSCKAAILNRLR